MPIALIGGSVLGLVATAILAIFVGGRLSASRLVYGICLALSVLAGGTAFSQTSAEPSALILPLGLPWLGSHLKLDALGAFFLTIINLGGAAASLYALGYGRHESAPRRVLPFFATFLAGMNLVLLAGDAFTFLVAWEFMSLSSWALVISQHRDPQNMQAGYIYLAMASFGTICLLLAFGLLAGPDGFYDFQAMREREMEDALSGLIFALALIGAGSKAGLVPLHVWLPLAHPAAPSHVSALMSGVMTKVAVYGFVRVVFDLLGTPHWWWSIIVLGLGAMTSVLGVLQALMQRDLKRLLAYSTIENIGIVFVGLGLALAFKANALDWAAALALTAALFHVFNHALFKSLLFFGSGAVLTATHSRDLDELGGLIHRMKATSFLVLIGAAAISALPPLNGFVSEWLTFQAILVSPQISQWGLKLMIPAVGVLLALAAALAGACFVRAFGLAFLGRPRSSKAENAGEVDRFSICAMAVLALLCLFGGILPGLVIDWIAPTVQSMVGNVMPKQSAVEWFSIVPIAEGRSSYNGLLVFLFIVLSSAIAVVAIHRFASHQFRRSDIWDCGFPDPSPATQYGAGSFAQPIRRVFGTLLLRVRETVDMPLPGEARAARLEVEQRDLIWETMYAPIAGLVAGLAERLNHLQFLTIRRYLSLVFLALIILLLVLAIWS